MIAALLRLWPSQRLVAFLLPDTPEHLNRGRAISCEVVVRVGVDQHTSFHNLVTEIDPAR